MKSKANSYGIILDYVGGKHAPVKKMWKIPLCLKGKQSLKRSYKVCAQINQCMTMKDGLIYACNTIQGIKHFNKYFNQNLSLSETDALDIYKAENQEEIISFLCTPKSFCRHCNRMGIELGIPYGPSKKDISEWT